MGQATVLPDPLDEAATTATTSIASADDLLSQLAGEEIDRLLAESEAERAAVEQPAPPAPAPALALPVVERVEANGPADDAIAATLAAAPAPLPAPVPEPVVAPAETAVPALEVLAPPAPIVRPETEPDTTAAAERAALTIDPLVSVRLPDEAHAATCEESDALPILLRPLVWLSAPLEACPESLREVVGKVAIVTLVNAVAVLAYVLLFRKH